MNKHAQQTRRVLDALFLVVSASLFFFVLVSVIAVQAPLLETIFADHSADESVSRADRFEALASLSTAITTLAIIGTVFTAWLAYQVHAKTARVQKTIDFIYRQVHDQDILDIIDTNRQIKKKYERKKRPITYENIMQDSEATAQLLAEMRVSSIDNKRDGDYIINLLNYYETWAIGIENSALEESLLKSWWRTTFVRDWQTYKTFVNEYRSVVRSGQAYCKVESLALRWAEDHEKPFC